jgi:hypothetical protein
MVLHLKLEVMGRARYSGHYAHVAEQHKMTQHRGGLFPTCFLWPRGVGVESSVYQGVCFSSKTH